MDERVAVHTAARRYCQERWAFLQQTYLGRSGDGPEADQEVGARSDVLAAILVDIESVTPGDFDSAQALRDALIVAGQVAQHWFPRRVASGSLDQAMADERSRFCTFVQGLTGDALHGVEPLPYCRSLGRAERANLRARLRERWGVVEGDYWHPLIAEELPRDVLAFQAAWFEHALPPAVLQDILRRHGVTRVWELHESGPEYEVDLAELDPIATGGEDYWTAGDMGWLLYASHESSITVAGEWLVAAVKAAWPGWEEHLYTNWDYELPPRGDER